MARMIPSTIERNDPRRNGEYMVFDWLSGSDIPGVCFYSLPQKNHVHKMIGEVDFLYICEQGMLCIEVKGGQDIYREERQWYSVNKKGIPNEMHDPFVQSRDCMYALGKYLKEIYGKYSPEANFQLGYCVVFPECICRAKGNDIVTEVMFDNRYNLNQFKDFIKETLEYWARTEVEKHFGKGSTPLNSKQVQQMVDLLQADFGSVPSMKLQIQHVEEKMTELSEEQMDIVEDMNDNRKVLVQGAAGTGKSMLAVAKADKALAKKKRVLYLCFNRNMAQYAKNNLPQTDLLTAKTFHALLGEYLEGDTYKISKVDLCNEFMSRGIKPKQYDVLVVDEAQDLMLECIWEVMDMFLEKGLESGEWVIFTDPNQSIFTDPKEYENGLDYLKELYSPTVLSLKKNWRNTAQIGRRTSKLTDVPGAKYMKIDGPKVECRRNISSQSELVKKLRQDIHLLLAGGTAAKDIVILSPHRLEKSALGGIIEMCNLRIVAPQDIYHIKPNQLNFFTAQSYKGLESSVVFYIDIDGFNSLENRQINYVAMSRAKALLYMYVTDEIDDEYDEMLDKNA